jgi:hypothetical protein
MGGSSDFVTNIKVVNRITANLREAVGIGCVGAEGAVCMQSQLKSRHYVLSHSRKTTAAHTREFLNGLGTFSLILALLVSGIILACWLMETVASAGFW